MSENNSAKVRSNVVPNGALFLYFTDIHTGVGIKFFWPARKDRTIVGIRFVIYACSTRESDGLRLPY